MIPGPPAAVPRYATASPRACQGSQGTGRPNCTRGAARRWRIRLKRNAGASSSAWSITACEPPDLRPADLPGPTPRPATTRASSAFPSPRAIRLTSYRFRNRRHRRIRRYITHPTRMRKTSTRTRPTLSSPIKVTQPNPTPTSLSGRNYRPCVCRQQPSEF